MHGGSLFSGIGLFDLGLHLAGIRHLWGCEADPERRAVWEQRFRAPCHPDVRELRGDAVPRVDVLAGGFPCKGASTAGKREGFGHPETVLWREMRRVIGEARPRYVVIENVANILAIADGAIWGEVLADLAALGFDAEWDCFPAAAFGAPHLRDRVFLVAADADQSRANAYAEAGGSRPAVGERASGAAADPAGPRGPAGRRRERAGAGLNGEGRRDHAEPSADWGEYGPAIRRWEAGLGRPSPEPLIRRVDDRSARRVERSRLSALGDGVLVQAGWFVGQRLMEFERMKAAA